MKRQTAGRLIPFVALSALVILGIFFTVGKRDGLTGDIVFNQHYIEMIGSEPGIFSRITLGFQDIFTSHRSIPELGHQSDIETVFDYVFSQIPPYAVVYPTELYYYYKIPALNLSGNLRLVDIVDGSFSFAYFNTENQSISEVKELNSKDGLVIKHLPFNHVKISYKNKAVIFNLPEIETKKPEKLPLNDDEEFVSSMRDESNTKLFIVFNNKTKSFYYVLNELEGESNELKKIGDELFINERTQYAFYFDKDWNRKILVGVGVDNIWKNNYFDGPFDQVPPYLQLREKIYKAYPYTQYLNGVDEHGNFIDWEGSRVAISSYVDYQYPETKELEDRINGCVKKKDKSELWSCLTYESKKDFHKTVPALFKEDGTPIR